MECKPLKITYIVMQWPCASETFCGRDILALRALGHRVDVLALKPAPVEWRKILSAQGTEDIKSGSLTISRYFLGAMYALLSPVILTKLVFKIIRRERNIRNILNLILLLPSSFWCVSRILKNPPDILHLFWGHYPSEVVCILDKVFPRDRPVLSMFLGAYDLQKSLEISKEASRLCDVVFSHARVNLGDLKSQGIEEEKIRIVHRGIELSAINSVRTSCSGQDKRKHKMIYVGRLIRQKGIHKVIEALPELEKYFPDIFFEIVGEGEERRSLEERARSLKVSDRVNFTGYLAPEEVYKQMITSEVLILPSVSESERLPNAVKEAMYSGCIPVVSKTQGIEELVTRDVTGFLLEENTPEEISRVIRSVFLRDDLSGMSSAAHQTIRDGFDVNSAMGEYVSIWHNIRDGT